MSNSRRQHIERGLARVERDRCRPLTEADMARLITQMSSDDEEVRAAALRRSCPCHVPWEAFELLRKPAQRLRRDPSPVVRALALHLEDDAREIAAMEAELARMRDRDDDMTDYRFRSRKGSRRSRVSTQTRLR